MADSPSASPWDGLTLVSPMLTHQLSEADALARSLRVSATRLLEQWDSPKPVKPLESALSAASDFLMSGSPALERSPPRPAEPSVSVSVSLSAPRDLSHLHAGSTEQLLEDHEKKTADMMEQHKRDLEERGGVIPSDTYVFGE